MIVSLDCLNLYFAVSFFTGLGPNVMFHAGDMDSSSSSSGACQMPEDG